MPLKPIIDIDVNDDRFKQFLELFEKYRAAVADLPGDWGRVGEAAEKSGTEFADMTAALLAQAELLHRLNQEHRELERSAGGFGRTMQSAAKEVRSIAQGVSDTTRHLLRWAGITGLLGIGGLWGIDRLAENASSLRTRSLGLGVSPGTVLAAQTNFGQFFNAQGALGNLANLQQSLTGQIAFNTLGISGAWNTDPGAALTSAMEAVHQLYRQTPAGERQNMPWYQQATQIFSPEEIRVLGNLSDAELHKREADYRQDRAGNFGLQPGTLRAAQDVDRQLTRVGYTLEYTFLAALKPVMPELDNLSKQLGMSVAAFLNGPGFANIVDMVREGLHDLGEWIGGPQFKTDVHEFIADVGALAKGVRWALKWLGLSSESSDAAIGAGAGAAAGGAVAGLPGAGAGAIAGGYAGRLWGDIKHGNYADALSGALSATNPAAVAGFVAGGLIGHAGARSNGDPRGMTPGLSGFTTALGSDWAAAAATIAQAGKAQGFSDDQIRMAQAGFLSAFQFESGISHDKVRPGGTDTGWAQWVGPRLAHMKGYGDPRSLEANEKQLYYELTGPYSRYFYEAAHAKTPTAAALAAHYFESGGAAQFEGGAKAGHLANAQAFYDKLGAHPEDFNREAWFAGYRQIVAHIHGDAGKDAPKRAATPSSPSKVEISVNNNTGGSAIISSSQMQLAY